MPAGASPSVLLQARLEVLDAETEGQLGFLLELELANALQHRQVAALLTQVKRAGVRGLSSAARVGCTASWWHHPACMAW